jgi:hypothetical protein
MRGSGFGGRECEGEEDPGDCAGRVGATGAARGCGAGLGRGE